MNSEATSTTNIATLSATKLENTTSRAGIVKVRGYTTVGAFSDGRGQVSIDAREFHSASYPDQVEYGISITVQAYGTLQQQNISFADENELESLMEGIEYLATVDNKITAMANFEVDCQTKNNFSICLFSNGEGGIGVCVSSGTVGKTSAFFNHHHLDDIKKLLVKARAIIDAAKIKNQ
jgi:hypothetical protein